MKVWLKCRWLLPGLLLLSLSSLAFAKLIPVSQESLVQSAELIIHARIDGIWEERAGFAIVRWARMRTLKGNYGSREIWVKYDLHPPCTPGIIQKLPVGVKIGREFILMLEAEPTASGTYRIQGQWQGTGMIPYSRPTLDKLRKLIKGLKETRNETSK